MCRGCERVKGVRVCRMQCARKEKEIESSSKRFSIRRIVYHASAVAQVMLGASWVRYKRVLVPIGEGAKSDAAAFCPIFKKLSSPD